MKTASRRGLRIVISGTALVLALSSAIFFLFYREVSFRKLELVYAMENSILSLMELYSSGNEAALTDLPDEVSGFGVYAGTGGALFFTGSAPRVLNPEPDHRFSYFEKTSYQEYRMIRRIGGAQSMSRMSGRGRGGAGQMILVLLDFDASGLLRGSNIVAGVLIGITLLIIILAVTVAVLFMRISRSSEEDRRKEKLVQLGHASRTLSHEIKNPLGIIRMQQAVLKARLPEEYTDSLNIIDSEVVRITRLVDRVGNFLKTDDGIISKVNVVSFASELSGKLPFKIDFTSDLPDNTEIEFDEDKLRSVIENILKNASESMDGKGVVRFSVSASGGNIEFSISDEGRGIGPDDMKKVFDPFFTTKENGQGIGLSISRNFINALGGDIRILNRDSGGTEVLIQIPFRNRGIE